MSGGVETDSDLITYGWEFNAISCELIIFAFLPYQTIIHDDPHAEKPVRQQARKWLEYP